MKVAIIHDWLEKKGGGEKVLEEIIKIFPNAELFVIADFMINKKDRQFLKKIKIKKSFIHYLPFSKNHFRKYIFFMPLAVKLFNLKKYNLIISSSSSFAKNINKSKNQLHICYCHTPSRYAHFMLDEYLKDYKIKNFLTKYILRKFLSIFAKYDIKNSNNVDYFIANSFFVRKRIKKIYKKNSEVMYPPININKYNYKIKKKNFFLTSSRLVPYKKVDLIIKAFNEMPKYKLVVCGDGPNYLNYKKLANKNIIFKGWVSDKKLKELLSEANAFIFAALEDFGIAPIEALASGTPVIALNGGGTKETISVNSKKFLCGLLFKKQNKAEIKKAVKKFVNQRKLFKSTNCRVKSYNYSQLKFKKKLISFVNNKVSTFHNKNLKLINF